MPAVLAIEKRRNRALESEGMEQHRGISALWIRVEVGVGEMESRRLWDHGSGAVMRRGRWDGCEDLVCGQAHLPLHLPLPCRKRGSAYGET